MTPAIALSVPLVTGAIGWITNVVAIRMLYGPERFVGIGPLGWQGVAFRHHDRFADGYAGVTAEYLLPSEALFDEITADDLETAFVAAVTLEELTPFVQDGLERLSPGLWKSLAPKFRASIVEQVRDETKALIREAHERLRSEGASLFDVRAFLRERLSADGGRTMAKISQEVGRRELRFIELFGGVFGLVVGVAEVLAWAMFQTWWILPLAGGVVGAITNWIALRMVFRPLEPIRFAGMTFQGLFPRRQHEFAREFATALARDALTVPAILEWMTRGEIGRRLETMLWSIVGPKARKMLDRWEMMLPIEVDDLEIERIRTDAALDVATWDAGRRGRFEAAVASRLDLARSMTDRLRALSPLQFEHLIRGPFEEDEWILVAVGFLLGALIGAAQSLLVLLG